jgi:hypothetical protein
LADSGPSGGQLSGDNVAFELVVFQRSGADVEVSVHGMSASEVVELVQWNRSKVMTLAVEGSWAADRVKPFVANLTVRPEPAQTIRIEGGGHREAIPAGQLPQNMPVVCGPDPMLAGLTGDFLHFRDGRLVLMHASAGAHISCVA